MEAPRERIADVRILITGGSGFIGRGLCSRFLETGDEVTVVSRDPGKVRAMDARLAAVRDPAEIPAERAPEAIVNLAGENLGSGRWNDKLKREFIASRVRVTRQVVEYIANTDSKPEVLVSGSAVGYYGARGDEELTEAAEPGDEFQSRLCSEWEAEALKAEASGVRVCRLRLGAVLSAHGGPLPSMLLPFRLGLGGHMGSGRQWLAWVHREDVNAVVGRLITDTDLSGAFNATAPQPETNRAFTQKLGAALHRPVLLKVPGWAVHLQTGEMAHLMLTGQRVIPRRLLDAGYEFRYPRVEDAFAEIIQ
jgi:uncharacterized protein (TIGR01777 family)